jgi:hypothetical protein
MALDGVVSNNAKYTLDSFDVQVTLKDYEDKMKETNCRIVGQASGTGEPNRSERANAVVRIVRPAV